MNDNRETSLVEYEAYLKRIAYKPGWTFIPRHDEFGFYIEVNRCRY